MKLKKWFAVCLIFALLLGLPACGGEAAGSEVQPGGEPSVPVSESPERQEPQAEAKEDFEEIVLVDDENCTFKITGIDADGTWGYTWKVYLENKSTDKNMMFSLSNCAVNGAMSDPLWAESVAAGMKSNTEVYWLESSFEDYGFKQVTVVDGILRVYDDDDWLTDYYEGSFTVYPMGEDAATLVNRQQQDGDIVLVDDEQFQVLATECYEDEVWGYTMKLYIVNRTDKNIMVSIDNCAVNGFMADPFWAVTVAAGKVCSSGVSWLSDDFESNGITEVETIDLELTITDCNSFDSLLRENVTVRP